VAIEQPERAESDYLPEFDVLNGARHTVSGLSPGFVGEFGHKSPCAQSIPLFWIAVYGQDVAPTAAAMARQLGAQG
jgi:hypothetical protein